jgi:transposase
MSSRGKLFALPKRPATERRKRHTRPCLQSRCRIGSMRRGELTDEQWEKLSPLLPPQKPRTGHPAKDHRLIVNGILWILRTGAPWRDLPERYGPWQTVASRFYRWQRAGIWHRILLQLQQQADGEGHVDWHIHSVDATIIRAHQHAAGAKGGSQIKKH